MRPATLLGDLEDAQKWLHAREPLAGQGLERVAKGRTGSDTELREGPVEVTADRPGR